MNSYRATALRPCALSKNNIGSERIMYKIALIIGGRVTEYFKNISDKVSVYGAPTTGEARDLAMDLVATENADAIVAPKLMANYLKNYVQIPVISSELTYYDIIDTLNYAERKSGIKNDKVAMVVHSQQAIEIEKIQPYIANRLYVYSYSDENQIGAIIEDLRTQHFHLIIGGTTTYRLGNLAGMYSYVIRFGRETLLSAIESAVAVLDYNRIISEKNQLLKIVLDSVSEGVMVTDSQERVVETNAKATEIIKLFANSKIENLGKSIDADAVWKKKLIKELRDKNSIVELGDVKLIINHEPIKINNLVLGEVFLFQEAARIENLEHEFRKKKTFGFVAKYSFDDIIGKSLVMRKTVEKAIAYSRSEATVLIEGESGTGKELFAQSIHNGSNRHKGPFVAINCAALPEALLESELMGYEEGAFTGAKRGGKSGMFELAHNGTIFLDEIHQIPLQLQARILRVLQERQVMRLGGERVIPVNIRIIAASNEKLGKLVQENRFREDLFYRLNILALRLPPLRERPEDIPLLINYFLKFFASTYGIKAAMNQESLNLIMGYDWPGNIRELMNFVERYMVINRQLKITDIEYVDDIMANARTIPDNDAILINIGPYADMEKQILTKILRKVSGNNTEAAMLLGLSRTTLWKKLRSHCEE